MVMTRREMLIEAMVQSIRSELHSVPDEVLGTSLFISMFNDKDTVVHEWYIERGIVFKDDEEIYIIE